MNLKTVGDVKRALRSKTTERVFVYIQISANYRADTQVSKAAALRMLKDTANDMPAPYAGWIDGNQTILGIGGYRHQERANA